MIHKIRTPNLIGGMFAVFIGGFMTCVILLGYI